MKPSIFSRFSSNKKAKEKPMPKVATAADIRRKLEHYQKKEGPANFGSAALYCINEVEGSPGAEVLGSDAGYKIDT